jgi:integrase
MSTLWREYQLGLQRRKKPKAVSTAREEMRRWENEIEPVIGHTIVSEIKRAEIATLIRKKADTAPVSANRLFSLLQVMFNEALDLGWIDNHPMFRMKKPGGQETPRKRFLSDDEINIIFKTHIFDNRLSDNPRDILRLILLTAQRPGEVMSMKWSDIDLNSSPALWTLSDTKNDATHIIPLSPQVLSVLMGRENRKQWVFPSVYNKAKGANSGHSMCTKKARENLQEWSGVVGWTAHDLRRTARTIMSRLQIKQHIRERVLNHSQCGIVAVYDQYDYLDEKRDALVKLADEIDRILSAVEESNG